MKENLKIIQLRGTIFIQQNIGYTDEVSVKFKNLLLPDGKIYGVPQAGVPFNGVNPNLPQYGMPWRLLYVDGADGEYNITFSPGKIDIYLNKESIYGDKTEENFCNFCSEKFGKILDELGGTPILRIAYAPLYGLTESASVTISQIWESLLKKTAYEGVPTQDVNLSFLIKKELMIGEKTIQMNFLHNIFDGFQSQVVDGQQKINKAVMLQLDINSIPNPPLNMDKVGMSAFFESVTITKDLLVENVIS